MRVEVIVATYGSEEWSERGSEAAAEALLTSGADVVSTLHGSSLAATRNELAEKSDADYLIFLDADDRLGEGYVDILKEKYLDSELDLLYKPSTLGWYPDGSYDDELGMIRTHDLAVRNEMVIGTALRRKDFPGFDECLDGLEDWDLFLRMYLDGAKIRECPEMVYIVGVNDNSRNMKSNRGAYQMVRAKHSLGSLSLPPERI